MDNEKKVQIKKLKSNKDYNQIYKLYGQADYLKCATAKFKKEDIKKLISEKRYYEIYEKYGQEIYNRYLKKFRKSDIIDELGFKPLIINFKYYKGHKRKLKLIKNSLFGFGFFVVSAVSVVNIGIENIKSENEKKYIQELTDYNNEIKKYAEYINSLNLDDLEVIVKVMSDMWGSIEGYKTPEGFDEIGIMRLSNYMNNYGVCRNFADDVAHRLNSINSSYNACVLATYIENAEVNNIERNIIESNETVTNENDSQNKNSPKYLANHAVVCLEIKDKNLILIIDPTNPSIGMLKDGKIEMFSEISKDGMYSTPLSDWVFSSHKAYLKLIKSFITNDNYEELKKEFDIESQNEALENIEQYENKYKSNSL